ncbi:MAG: PhoH family protein [Lachnospiraceae bacterium]|nr:PhoH family protein [Lachnospiraceae bacterium]MBR1522946.1 PhoH family protein [Lachnospiraceae bacterium]
MTKALSIKEYGNPVIQEVAGTFDKNIKYIEKRLGLDIAIRADNILIEGSEVHAEEGAALIKELIALAEKGETIDDQKLNYTMDSIKDASGEFITSVDDDVICHTVSGKPVKPKTVGQKKYADSIDKKMIVFGIGPAGTGKTYIAIAKAVTAFKREEISRIILTRPAIEAGEKLGFLPGDLQSKIDPYLRPLYDALYSIMGAESFQKNMEKGLIEVAPLAYMRGRTLDNAFIILDEAQNTTPAQMKMFLTRIGFGSKVVVTGDKTQKDLAEGTVSGLDVAERVLGKIDDIGFIYLTAKDVVRHPLVQKIVKAYEEYEVRQSTGREKRKGRTGNSRSRK